MHRIYDVIIIGGGIIGLSTAYHLSKKNKHVVVLEKKYPGYGSTGRCIGGIRGQFSTENSIMLMKESIQQFKRMEKDFGFSVGFLQSGYLFLAHNQETLNSFKKTALLQRKLGLKIDVLNKKGCLDIVPQLNSEDLIGGVYSPDDGQAYPFKVVKGYIEQIKENGSEIRTFSEVIEIDIKKNRVCGVLLNSGERISASAVLNAAGPWATDICKMAGIEVSISIEEHEAFITERIQNFCKTMIVDYRSDGCYFNQRINGQIIGCYSPHPAKPGRQIKSSLEFMLSFPKRILRLIPDFGNVNILRQWGGSYANTPDGSPIIDKTGVTGFFIAAGMSGHGFMFAPVVGKYMSDIIIEDKFPDELSDFKLKRNYNRKEIMK